MQPTVHELTEAIAWLERQMTALEQRLRSRGETGSLAKMKAMLDSIQDRDEAPKGVDAKAWAAIRWVLETLQVEGATRIAKTADGSVNLLGTTLLYGKLDEAPAADEDDFAAILG